MLYAVSALIAGLILLVWSADKFVEGAASTAKHFGMPPLLIGIVVIGFGTSAPEIIVSASSALSGASGIALGNAYGSNISNIALILGTTALIKPISVASTVIKKELPVLILVTLLSAYLIYDAQVTRPEAVFLLAVFILYMGWTIRTAFMTKRDRLAESESLRNDEIALPLKKALFWLFIGLLILMGSSQLLVWGAVEIARYFGVSDLLIGLTIVAIGTSLPELASSVAAARKGESDLAFGNIVGSNLFNSLAVVGIAGAIDPMRVEEEIFSRDMFVMGSLTLLLFVFAFSFRKDTERRISRSEGGVLLLSFVGYTFYLIKTAL